MSTITWRNLFGSNGFAMKAMHPARLSSFAMSAVAKVRATTGIRLVTGSALSRWANLQAIHLRHHVVEKDQTDLDDTHHLQRHFTVGV